MSESKEKTPNYTIVLYIIAIWLGAIVVNMSKITDHYLEKENCSCIKENIND